MNAGDLGIRNLATAQQLLLAPYGLDEAKLQHASDSEDFLHATWTPDVGDGPVRADFKPMTLSKPFNGLDVPRSVVPGAAGCGR